MGLTQKQKTIKYFFYCVMIVVFSLLQNVAGLWLEIGNARCFFIIPVTVLLCIDEDIIPSIVLGLFAGILWDAISAQSMMFNTIFITVICIVSSMLVSFVFRNKFWINATCIAVSSILYAVLYWFIFIQLKKINGGAITLLNFYLPSALYTIIIGLVLYPIFKEIKNKLNHEMKDIEN